MADTPFVYDASPTTADTVVTLQELSSLMSTGGKGFVKDPRKVMHFVRRVGITVQASLEQARGMRRMIEQLQLEREHAGTPTTLSPSDAAKFMPSEELARLAGGRAADELEAAVRIRKEADTTRRTARAELNQVRYVVSTMLESPAISPDTRDTFKRLLAELASKWPADSAGGEPDTQPPETNRGGAVVEPGPVSPDVGSTSLRSPDLPDVNGAGQIPDADDQPGIDLQPQARGAESVGGTVTVQTDAVIGQAPVPVVDVARLAPPPPTAAPLADAPPIDRSSPDVGSDAPTELSRDAAPAGDGLSEQAPGSELADGGSGGVADGEDEARGGLESVFG